jgi:hypothetical protein
MSTVRAETFDLELFGKLVALFDSNQAGEAENAFRRAVIMCARNGMHFSDAARVAFGQGDDEVAALQEQLRQQEAEHANHLTEAAAEIERLRAELAGETPEGEHVIDLPGRLRRAWVFPQFRLLVLTVMIAATSAVGQDHAGLARFFGALCVLLFGAWSVAQFRKRGIGQMFMKWIVYAASLVLGGMLADSADAANRPALFLGVLAVALVLTLSKLSGWLGEKVREHVWESEPMHVVRELF